jgi:hypothetical protein
LEFVNVRKDYAMLFLPLQFIESTVQQIGIGLNFEKETANDFSGMQ